jgi:hypothetical protein
VQRIERNEIHNSQDLDIIVRAKFTHEPEGEDITAMLCFRL